MTTLTISLDTTTLISNKDNLESRIYDCNNNKDNNNGIDQLFKRILNNKVLIKYICSNHHKICTVFTCRYLASIQSDIDINWLVKQKLFNKIRLNLKNQQLQHQYTKLSHWSSHSLIKLINTSSLDIIELLLEKNAQNLHFTPDVLSNLILNNQQQSPIIASLSLIGTIVNRFPLSVTPQLHQTAAVANRLDVIHHFYDLVAPSSLTATEAARLGHLDIVKYLDERGAMFSIKVVDGAAGNNHLEVVKFLIENRTESCTVKAIDDAATNGHIDVVRYLISHRDNNKFKLKIKYTMNAVSGATNAGNLEMLKLLLQYEKEMSVNYTGNFKYVAYHAAINKGNVEILNWLQIKQHSLSCMTWYNLTPSSGLALLKFMLARNVRESIEYSATAGQLEIVKFLLENKISDSSTIIKRALSSCKLDTMCYIHRHTKHHLLTTQIERAIIYSIQSQVPSSEIIKYLEELMTSTGEQPSYQLEPGISYNDKLRYSIELFDFYYQRFPNHNYNYLKMAVTLGHINFIERVVLHHEITVSDHWYPKAMMAACSEGRLDILMLLHDHRPNIDLLTIYKNDYPFHIIRYMLPRMKIEFDRFRFRFINIQVTDVILDYLEKNEERHKSQPKILYDFADYTGFYTHLQLATSPRFSSIINENPPLENYLDEILHQAAFYGYNESIVDLFERHNLKFNNVKMLPCLFRAATNGNINIVVFLLSKTETPINQHLFYQIQRFSSDESNETDSNRHVFTYLNNFISKTMSIQKQQSYLIIH